MSCLDASDFIAVVWKINTGLKHIPPVLKSKPFLLLDSERNLELHLRQNSSSNENIDLTLYLRPPVIQRCFGGPAVIANDATVQVMSVMRENSSILKSSVFIQTTGIDEIWSFTEYRGCLPAICEIFCQFRCVPGVSQSSPESETIRFLPLDSHLKSLSSDFGRFLEDKTFTDVTLKCGDRTISAHRAVLAARSPIFAAMFRNKMAERENGVVELKDLDPDMLESFLQYLYSGRIMDLSENNVCTYFSNGDKYVVPALQQECSKWITQHLTRENYISFLQLADAHNYEDLKENVVDFIAKNNSVLKSEEWSQFNEMNPKLANFIYQKYIDRLVTIT